MTQQHDAPEGGVEWKLMPGVGQCTDAMSHAMARLDGYDEDPDMPGIQRWKDYWDAAVTAAPTPPAPSGLVDAVRAYLAAVDENDAFYSRNHTSHAAGIMLKAKLMSTRATLDATLSGQQSTSPAAASERDMAAFGAGEASCVYAPGADQASIRRAFEDGAAYAYTGKLPPESATLSGQQGGVVPAGDLRPGLREAIDCLAEELKRSSNTKERGALMGLLGVLYARLAEQPAPAVTGDADRVEGLRPGIEKALEIVEAERETVSVSSSAYQRLWSVRNALRDVLDGASGQREG